MSIASHARTWIALAAVAGLLAAGAAAGPGPTWQFRMLPVAEDWIAATPNGVCEAGVVAGVAWDQDAVAHAVVWEGDEYRMLVSAGGDPRDWTLLTGLSRNGLAVGISSAWPEPPAYRATVWNLRTGTVLDLHPGTIVLGGIEYVGSWANNANAAGDVCGDLWSVGYDSIAYFWSRDGKEDHVLPLLPGTTHSLSWGIDAQGDVVGTCWGGTQGNLMHACLWPRAGGVVDLHPAVVAAHPDLAVRESRCAGIAEDGTISGTVFLDDEVQSAIPALWSGAGEVRLLDLDGSLSGWSGGLAGRWASGQLGGTWWIPGDPARCAVWEDGDLVFSGRPEGYRSAWLNGIDRTGRAVGVAWEEEDVFSLTVPHPFVLERTTR